MNSQQSAMMMACGLVALMILSMFSIFIAFFIFVIFGLQESALGPLMLGSMVGLISLLVYMSKRDDKKFEQKQVQSQLDYELHWQKRNLVNLAIDFKDSRKNIASQMKREQRLHEMKIKSKPLSLDDDYDYGCACYESMDDCSDMDD